MVVIKTVKGKVLSTAPASISRAAHVLNNFISSPNGASQAISVYLRRASNAINELRQLHKELNSSSSRSHRKNHTKAMVGVGNPNFSLEVRESPPEAKGQVPSHGADENEQKRTKNKSKEHGELEVKGDNGNIGAESIRKKHKKMKEEVDAIKVEDKLFENGEVAIGSKLGSMEMDEKPRKKRKSVEVEESEKLGADDKKSRKKRKKSVDDG